jgi:hypothetical protein
LRERLQETPEPHSRIPIISPEFIEKLHLNNQDNYARNDTDDSDHFLFVDTGREQWDSQQGNE